MTQQRAGVRDGRSTHRNIAWAAVLLLILSVLAFAVIRVLVDAPNIATGTIPDPGSFEHRYATYPWLAYAHIAPGVVYLLIAPLQLSYRVRSRQWTWHRRLGRVAIAAGILSGVLGMVFGVFLSFGGPIQASAAVVFGTYLVTALALAYRFIRRGDVHRHRRWMIRAFAIGLAVGSIRLWVGFFAALDLLPLRDAFGPAFWLGFLTHAVAAELWLRWRPAPTRHRPSSSVPGTRAGAPTT